MPGGTFLDQLPSAGRDAVLAAAVPRSWDRGELVTRDGDDASSLMVVTGGHLLVHLRAPGGERVALAVVGPGDVLGEVGLLSRRRERTADAQTLEPVTALVLRRGDFDRVRRDSPRVDDFVMELMARRIDRLSHLVFEAHHLPVDVRVARRVHDVGRLYAAGSGRPTIPLTQEDIADLAGTTRPSANLVLRRLEADRILQLHRGRIEILDVWGLRERCG